ncbi:MAG TPA: ATP-dependent Clp protease ATP-binding subunit, partial [Bacillota bacterium]|nr:ATP-dependent Clp protease ATP-binding subunit [Bacillota bacterium]
MNLRLCSRCKQRVAVVFVTRIEGKESFNEGLCIKCAKELGIKPISDIMDKLGVSEDDLDAMTADLNALTESGNTDDEGRAPAIDLEKLFSGQLPQ